MNRELLGKEKPNKEQASSMDNSAEPMDTDLTNGTMYDRNRMGPGSTVQPYAASRPGAPFGSNHFQRHQPTTVPKNSRRSIVRTVNQDDDDDEPEIIDLIPPLQNRGGLMNSFMPGRGAAGSQNGSEFDLDADAAYALRLQQEEYARDTMYIRAMRRNSPPPVIIGGATASTETQTEQGATAMSDAEYAAMLQAEEDRMAAQRRSPPFVFRPSLVRVNPESSQRLPPREGEPPTVNRHFDSDDDDDQLPPPAARAFFEMLTRHNMDDRNIPPVFRFFGGRFPRRSNDLTANTDDFGPEDYERLLELDNSVKKKTLTDAQINRIPTERFTRNSTQTEEDILCSICLEKYEDNDELRKFACKHTFHRSCADRWLKENNICPICREVPIMLPLNNQSRHRQNHNERSNRTRVNSNGRSNPTTRHNFLRRGQNNNHPS